RVDERYHRHMKFFRQLHQAKSFSVPLRMRHAEVALEQLLGIASAQLSHHHDGLAVELYEIREDKIDQLRSERSLRITCDLNPLPWREIAVDLLAQLDELALERCDLIRDVHLSLAGEPLQLVDLPL